MDERCRYEDRQEKRQEEVSEQVKEIVEAQTLWKLEGSAVHLMEGTEDGAG